ncbi:MAG: phosphodiester glycosidase family protein [Ignavibacterium sp.]|jgi:exopolysaccharide biosynthesis protein|nr:phosphodiester glycosidase family protein [Ignavibacterium sp.]
MITKLSLVYSLLALTIYPQVNTFEQIIDKGIVHKQIINSVDTLSIHVLQIDLSSNEYELRTVKADNLLNAKETTSEMVSTLTDSGFNVIAAINADFFEGDGEIINNMISEGEYVKAVKFTDSPFNPFVNTQFAIMNDNKLLMEQFVFNAQLVLSNGIAEPIGRINSKADSSSITLYNSFQGDYTPKARDNWFVSEVSLKILQRNLDTLFCIIADSFEHGGNKNINTDFVLSTNNKYAHYLEREINRDDTVKIILQMNPSNFNITELAGGWPLLVKDGINLMKINYTAEGDLPRFSKVKHPRTGIGFSKDSSIVYFITVDGRQESSSGMTLMEFADLMIEEGIYQGLNLDGGGSTTMVVNNKVVNSPSDITGERKVGNCIVLIKKQD